MKWVLLFFYLIFGLFFLALLLLLLSTIKINIKELNFNNVAGESRDKLRKKFKIFIEIYLFGKIKIARIILDNNIIKQIKSRFNFKKIKNNAKKLNKIKISKILNILKLKIEKANLNIQIGTENAIFTAFVVTFISTILRNHI